MDCSLPGSSVHGISQARTLEWVAISSSRGSSSPRDGNRVSCIGRGILYHWAIREAPLALHWINPSTWLLQRIHSRVARIHLLHQYRPLWLCGSTSHPCQKENRSLYWFPSHPVFNFLWSSLLLPGSHFQIKLFTHKALGEGDPGTDIRHRKWPQWGAPCTGPSRLLQVAEFHSFYSWKILHCLSIYLTFSLSVHLLMDT